MSIQDDYKLNVETMEKRSRIIADGLDKGFEPEDLMEDRIAYARAKGWLACYHKTALTPHPAAMLGDWISLIDDAIECVFDDPEYPTLNEILAGLRAKLVAEHERTLRESP